jgi:hypothetical protein
MGRLSVVLPVALAAIVVRAGEHASTTDPFSFLRPSIVVSSSDRRQLDKGLPVVRILPGQDREVGLFAAVATDADGDRLVAWMRQIEALKKSDFVRQIGRFSKPPKLEDLAGLSLDDDDLADIRRCRPTDCTLKLGRAEIEELRRVAESGGDSKAALQGTFRRLVLRRVEAFLQGGHDALPVYENSDAPVQLGPRFSSLIKHSALTHSQPRLVEYLEGYPHVPFPDLESFIYWSKEGVGPRPIVSATEVNILRGTEDSGHDALIVGRELFSTHYVNASLSVTAIVRGTGSRNYLVYVNRTDIDVLGRFMGGIIRPFIERRLRAGATDLVQRVRVRVESGAPQSQVVGALTDP